MCKYKAEVAGSIGRVTVVTPRTALVERNGTAQVQENSNQEAVAETVHIVAFVIREGKEAVAEHRGPTMGTAEIAGIAETKKSGPDAMATVVTIVKQAEHNGDNEREWYEKGDVNEDIGDRAGEDGEEIENDRYKRYNDNSALAKIDTMMMNNGVND